MRPAPKSPEDLRLRPASEEDAELVLELIRELAAYERLLHEVEADPELIRAALFGPNPRVFCDIAEIGGVTAGFALWFYSFSTFRGRHGIYLEDLFVRPSNRGFGVGRALLAGLARRCAEEGLARLEWSVLDWNEPALGFYRALGAEPREGWSGFRLAGEALARLGEATA
jgi:GNAT superfamily N-acetyltransferase